MKPIIQRELDALQAQIRALEARLTAVTNSQLRALRLIGETAGRNDQFNVRNFGAAGDGLSDDGPAIHAAMQSAATASQGTGPQDYGGLVYLPRGTYYSSVPLVIPNGVGLVGAGPTATVVLPVPSFNSRSLIRNERQDGTQEFAFLESLQVNGAAGTGAVCSVAIVDLVSLFINSYVRDVIVLGGSNVGLRFAASNGMGPIYVENAWVLNNGGHNVLVEETGSNTQASVGMCFVNLTSEHQGSNSSAIHLSGSGHSSQYNFINTHIEQGTAATGRTSITIDNVAHVIFDGVQILADPSTVSRGILITTAESNVDIQIRGVYNPNLINPILDDRKNGVTKGAENIPTYLTADIVQGLTRFRPASSGSKGLVVQDYQGNDKLWSDGFGRVSGSSFFQASLDLVGDRPLVMAPPSLDRAFGFSFPDGSSFRLRYFTGPVDLLNFTNQGDMFVYGPATFQQAVIGFGSSAGAPSSGLHTRGEIYFSADPSAGGFIGWVCVNTGTPGTWKQFGAISA